jgi:chromosome segregation ATPase
MAFKTSKDQLARRDALAADLRRRANELNVAIATYNEKLDTLVREVVEAQARYNDAMERARTLASEISEPAQAEFDAKSDRWQESDAGIRIRLWIEQWEISLDDVELELAEPLEEIDPEEHAGQLEAAVGKPAELEHVH